MTGLRHRAARTTAVLAGLSLLAACGGGAAEDDRTPSAADTTIASEGPAPTTASGPRAAARWETVVTLEGTGSTVTAPFTILDEAIQWRARWECTSGTLRVESDPPPRRPAPLVEAPSCPLTGEGFSIVTGQVKLSVTASGPWKMIVDQQVDVPLNEPPLPAMASARVVGQGEFYNVEKNGKGTARLYQLGDGTRALRFEDLEVNQNTDLFVWLNTAANPKTSRDAVSADYWVLGNLKSTVGSQNYVIPPEIPVDRVRSIVIWCEPVAIAYAAAALAR
ncbi:MAG: DM13 domain-containing protein [Acidimicrobiia bacterium]